MVPVEPLEPQGVAPLVDRAALVAVQLLADQLSRSLPLTAEVAERAGIARINLVLAVVLAYWVLAARAAVALMVRQELMEVRLVHKRIVRPLTKLALAAVEETQGPTLTPVVVAMLITLPLAALVAEE